MLPCDNQTWLFVIFTIFPRFSEPPFIEGSIARGETQCLLGVDDGCLNHQPVPYPEEEIYPESPKFGRQESMVSCTFQPAQPSEPVIKTFFFGLNLMYIPIFWWWSHVNSRLFRSNILDDETPHVIFPSIQPPIQPPSHAASTSCSTMALNCSEQLGVACATALRRGRPRAVKRMGGALCICRSSRGSASYRDAWRAERRRMWRGDNGEAWGKWGSKRDFLGLNVHFFVGATPSWSTWKIDGAAKRILSWSAPSRRHRSFQALMGVQIPFCT